MTDTFWKYVSPSQSLWVRDKRVSGFDRDMTALSGFEYVTEQCSLARPLSRHLSHFRMTVAKDGKIFI